MREQAELSNMQGVVVAALAVMVGLGVVAAALMLWAGLVIGMAAGVAELLEQTNGLAEATYDTAFVLAAVGTVVLGGGWLHIRFGKRPTRARQWQIEVGAAAAMLAVTGTLAAVDLRTVDVPDLLTAALLQMSLGAGSLLLAVWVFRGALHMWKVISESDALAGAFGVVLPLMVLVRFGGCEHPDEDETLAVLEGSIESVADVADERGLLEASRSSATEVSGEIDTSLSTRGESSKPKQWSDARDFSGGVRAAECMEKLIADGSPSFSEEAVIKYRGRLGEDARDLVHDTIIEVCEEQVAKPDANVGHHFKRRIRDRVSNARRNRWVRAEALRNMDVCPTMLGRSAGSPDPLDHYDLRKSLCALEQEDRRVIVLSAKGYSAAQIGLKSHGVKSAAVRQRRSRALTKLKALMKSGA